MRLAKRKYGWKEMAEWKKNEWVIEGLLKKGQVLLLTGNPKVGKSFIALRAAAAVSSGDNFFGREAVEGKVLYLAAERALSLEDRGNAIIESNIPFNTDNIEVYPKPVAFLDERELSEFIKEAGDTDLIIIDTLRRCFAGGRENDNNDMTAWVYGVERFCEETGAAAIVIHHNQRRRYDTMGRITDGDFAGAGALLGSVDCQLQVSKNAKGDITLREVESNNKTSFVTDIRIENVTLSDGTSVGMAVSPDASDRDKPSLELLVKNLFRETGEATLSQLYQQVKDDALVLKYHGTPSKETVRLFLAAWQSDGIVWSKPSKEHKQQRIYILRESETDK